METADILKAASGSTSAALGALDALRRHVASAPSIPDAARGVANLDLAIAAGHLGLVAEHIRLVGKRLTT